MAGQLINNQDTSKLLIGDNTTVVGSFTNGGGSAVTLDQGTVMGRISATGKLVALTSAASDGSQFVVGVLCDTTTVAAGGTVDLTLCDSGEINQSMVKLQGSDTLETVVGGRRIKDKIGAETVGVKLIVSNDLTNFDNQ